jgi:tRNA modification GTPase
MSLKDTIYALSSGAGRAGVAVIRISGLKSGHLIEKLCGRSLCPRKAFLKSIVHPLTGETLDQALVLWFPSPSSFTGEDVAELHIHGGSAVIAAVMEAIGSLSGMRMAEAGEFTRRAFYNGKLDLTGIEAVSDLVDAQTEAQRKQALVQMGGGFSDVLENLRYQLIHILAYIEASIDFSDEDDVGENVNDQMLENIRLLKNEIDTLLEDGKSGERVREGLQVVIAGPPNAGKSSLLNSLAKRDVAIVSNQAGTTRDVIDVYLDLGGFPVMVCDTAGLRDIGDSVEEEGVRRARGRIDSADVILWTTDGTIAEEAYDFAIDSGQYLIRVRNKCDLDSIEIPTMTSYPDIENLGVVTISARTGEGLERLMENITKIATQLQSGGERALITRARHREALKHATGALSAVLENPHQAVELVAENLRICARELGRITGSVDVEDLLDVIFRDFCIGK